MTGRIDVTAPATISVVNGAAAVASELTLPPFGITLSDPVAGDTLSVTLIARNAGATLATGAASGALAAGQGNTLILSGTAAELSAALSALQLREPAGATADLLTLTASDPAALPASTDIAVDIQPAIAPAFASPPASLSVQPNALSPLPGLVLGDPDATALAAAGQGQQESLSLTLSVAAGILLLPGLAPASGVAAAGQGSGTITLSFTADQLGAVNAALAGLTYFGPGQTRLSYRMSDLAGPLGTAVTSGAVTLNASGSPGGNGTFTAGGDTLIAGSSDPGALTITGLTADTGNLGASLFIGAAGTLEMPDGVLSLSGTSDDFGWLATGSLDLAGSAILAEGASIAAGMTLASGLLDAGGALQLGGQADVSLAAGAVLTGGFTLAAGSAETGTINGQGTLLAGGGATLLVAAADISGGELEVAGGGVLALTPQTLGVASGVTLAFAQGYGVVPITGFYADTLAQDGGVAVIGDPAGFAGEITGFSPGDRLILPGLSGLSFSDITAQSFLVSGTNSTGALEEFTLHAAIPTGATLFAAQDAAGDAEIGLRASPGIFLGGSSLAAARIDASAGVGQSLQGLQVLAPGWTNQSLILTLSVAEGELSDGTLTPSASLVLSAANPAALNALLAEVVYTASLATGGDTLTASSNAGPLTGLSGSVAITIESGGTVSGFSPAPTDEQTALFTGSTASLVLETQAAAPGAIDLSGAVDFADLLAVGGIGGTALSIDGGGIGVFDAAAQVTLAANAVIGDAGGAGTLGIVTDDFTIGSSAQSAGLLVGGNSAAPGSAVEITGALAVQGEVALGQQAAARLDLSGTLSAAETTLGAAGTLIASGDASAAFGDLADSGTLVLENAAEASAQQLLLAGQLALGGGTRLGGLNSAVIATGGSLILDTDGTLSAFGLNEIGGAVLDRGSLLVSGNLLADAAITLAGGMAEAAAMTLSSGAVLSGYGEVVADTGVSLAGEIEASGGTLILDGDVTMSNGSILIAGSASLDLIGAASGGEIGFSGTDAELIINDIATDSSAVAGMRAGDVIDLVGVAPSLVSDSAGTISARDAEGNFLGGFALGTAAAQPAISIISDGEGGALITLGGELACFARGTRLLTPNGYVPVEAFKPGDPVITRLGIRRAVRWIGRRDLEIDLKDRRDARPVTLLPGAIGPGVPSRPVRLSPSHAVFLENALVPVMHLVNGATILREKKRGTVSYFHVELDRHDVLMAEGLPVESYIDTGNRGEFRHEQGVRANCRKPCARLITSGPKLARIRRMLHQRALAAGFALAQTPQLQAVLGDDVLEPALRQNGAVLEARFCLPHPAQRLLLLAQSAAPAETDPDSDDRRELAICLRQPRAKSRRLVLGEGWYPKAAGDAGVWMSGSGEILLPPDISELTLNLMGVVQSWRRPGGV